MFRQYRVIFRQLVFITSPSYINTSTAAVGNTGDITIIHLLIKSIFITDCTYGHHTDRLRKNCNNNDFTPFYFKSDSFNVLKILL